MNVVNNNTKIVKLPPINEAVNSKKSLNNGLSFNQFRSKKYIQNKENNKIQQIFQNQSNNQSVNSNKSFIIKNKKALDSIFNDTEDTDISINFKQSKNQTSKNENNTFSSNLQNNFLNFHSNYMKKLSFNQQNQKKKMTFKYSNINNNLFIHKQEKDYIIEDYQIQIPQIQNQIKENDNKSFQQINNYNNVNPIKNELILQQNQQKPFLSLPTFQQFKKFINVLLQNIYLQLVITLLTIVSLFMEDFRTIFVDSINDQYLDYVNILFLILFFSQILMSLTIQLYPFSFFFWLDLISTLSIIMDIKILTNLLYDNNGSSQQLNIILAQSKASRAAARAVRIMKIFRLTRIVKVYKSALKTKQLNQKRHKQLKQKLKNKKKFLVLENQKLLNVISEGQTLNHQIENSYGWNQLSIKHSEILKVSDKELKSGNNYEIFLSPNGPNILNTHKLYVNPIFENMNVGRKSQKNKKIEQLQCQEDYDNQKKHNGKSFTKLTYLNQFTNNCLISKQRSVKSKRVLTRHDISQSYCSSIKSQQNSQQSQIQDDSQFNLQLSMKESNISKVLTDSTIKKIIIVILIIMITMSAMDINNYAPENSSWDFLTSYICQLLQNRNIPISFINKLIQNNIDSIGTLNQNYQIVAIQTPFNQLLNVQFIDTNDLRMQQLGISQAQISVSNILKIRKDLTLMNKDVGKSNQNNSITNKNSISVVLSFKNYNRIDSWFSIFKIIVICIIIIYLLQAFNNNISNLIVSPIQKMLQTIIDPEKKILEEEQETQDFKQAKYQTMIVQKAILKIRGLMSTIFGKVGMDLIYKQIFKTENISAKSYLKIKKKSFSIYGICKIHNFEEIAETLQSDTFNFLNQIAQIVHKAVFRYGGFGIKNLSDGFLIVFNLPQGKQQQIMEEFMKSKCTKKITNTYLNIFCDFGIFSFIKTLVRLHKQPKILQYAKDSRIINKFGHNFQVQVSLSMGLGQSIQGIIGSQFKIDPVFLGGKIDQIAKISMIAQRHPNMIIIEKQLYQKLSIALKRNFRVMQYVKLNEYDQCDTQLYAIDLDLDCISPSRNKQEKYKKNEQQPDIYIKKQLNMEILKDETQISNYSVQDFINKKKQFKQVLKKKISDDVKRKYQMAFHSYIAGDWVDAKQLLQSILKVTKTDSLTKRLYKYMAYHKFKYPRNFNQYKTIQDLLKVYQYRY